MLCLIERFFGRDPRSMTWDELVVKADNLNRCKRWERNEPCDQNWVMEQKLADGRITQADLLAWRKEQRKKNRKKLTPEQKKALEQQVRESFGGGGRAGKKK